MEHAELAEDAGDWEDPAGFVNAAVPPNAAEHDNLCVWCRKRLATMWLQVGKDPYGEPLVMPFCSEDCGEQLLEHMRQLHSGSHAPTKKSRVIHRSIHDWSQLPLDARALSLRGVPILELEKLATLSKNMRSAVNSLRMDEDYWQQQFEGDFGAFFGVRKLFLSKWYTQARILLDAFPRIKVSTTENDWNAQDVGQVTDVVLRNPREHDSQKIGFLLPLPLSRLNQGPLSTSWIDTAITERTAQELLPFLPLPMLETLTLEGPLQCPFLLDIYLPTGPPETWYTRTMEYSRVAELDRSIQLDDGKHWELVARGRVMLDDSDDIIVRAYLGLAGDGIDDNLVCQRVIVDVGEKLRHSSGSDVTSAVCGAGVILPKNVMALACRTSAKFVHELDLLAVVGESKERFRDVQTFQVIGDKYGGKRLGWQMQVKVISEQWVDKLHAGIVQKAQRAATMREPPRLLTPCPFCQCAEYPVCVHPDNCDVCRIDGKTHRPWFQQNPFPEEEESPPQQDQQQLYGVMAYNAVGKPVAYIPTPGLYAHGSHKTLPKTQRSYAYQPPGYRSVEWKDGQAIHSLRVAKGDREGIAAPIDDNDNDSDNDSE